MAIQKALRIVYQAKNSTTGLADVKAQVYLNGVAKAVGASAIVLSELSATNSPGMYELVIPAATLTTWGVVAGAYNVVDGSINSATQPASSPFRAELTVANTDDLDIKLGSPAGASLSVDIAAVKSDTAAIKVDLESGASSLATILAGITAIQNNAGFAMPVPSTLIKPSSGSNSYRIPVKIYNSKNQLINPDSSVITVGLKNQSGADRGSYLTGSSGSPATVSATNDSVGQFHVDFAIPSTAAQEELIFSFDYIVGGIATARVAVSEVITDVAADGFALQTTLLSTQTTVNAINALTTDATNGLAAIKAQGVSNATAIASNTSALTALQSDLTNNVEGAGFVVGTDSLHQISLYLTSNLFSGGRAV